MRVLEIFERIAQIPHCSGHTRQLGEFIQSFGQKHGYKVEKDRAGNILCYLKKRDICLQAHYDMVCVGKASKIELIQKDGWLEAKDSSLGADNGIGVAIMLALMQEKAEAEFLFTNDEEIGLVGAKNLELQLQASRMLNLDSEEFGKVYVGCAGGVDIVASKNCTKERADHLRFYSITAKNFPGGHSGVDIDKDIPNAIKAFVHFAKGAKIAWLEAGERLNSIPVHLEGVIGVEGELHSNEWFDVRESLPQEVVEEDVWSILCGFADGVRGWQKEFGIPSRSANLAKIEVGDKLHIACSLRANSDEDLQKLECEYRTFFESFGLLAKSYDRYQPWEPVVTPFAKEVGRVYERYGGAQFAAIHAGLECAVFAKQYPSMQIASIGPTIQNPHSIHERVRLADIEPIYAIAKELIR